MIQMSVAIITANGQGDVRKGQPVQEGTGIQLWI